MTLQTSTQSSTVVPLFASDDTSSRDQPVPTAKLYGLPLQAGYLVQQIPAQKSFSWWGVVSVVVAHALVIYALISNQTLNDVKPSPVKPMMVSLIAPPAPEPEIVPIIEPKPIMKPKPVIKPKPVLKKVVEKPQPLEQPTEPQIEVVAEEPVIEEAQPEQVAPVPVAETAKAPPKSEPVIEDKIEPPRFGVSYLSNPAPEYPSMSRRLGEEGRVLMKVLVSAEGAAADVQIETSSGSSRLDRAAVNAVKQWRFIPAKKNNQPLSAYVLVPISFALNG